MLHERRRSAPRIKFYPPLHAKYMFIDGTRWADCLVIDTSSTGAQLEFAQPPGAIAEFFLMFTCTLPHPVYRRCKTIWFNGNRMGVEFQKLHVLHPIAAAA